MQLRSSSARRLQGRYREDDIPDLPGIARFVHPTIPYNPNLPPAAFPTLDQPRHALAWPAEAMEVPSRPESPESDPEQDILPRRATVFRGKIQSSNSSSRRGVSFGAESEEVSRDQDSSKIQAWGPLDEPGEYDGYGVMANDGEDNEGPRIGLTVSTFKFCCSHLLHPTD